MNSIKTKETVKRVEVALKKFDKNLNIIFLEQSAKTALDAATALGCNVGAIVKSLLFRTELNYILCLVAGDKRCSLKKLKIFLDLKDISMASPDEVKNITGYTIGGVSPIGHLNKIQTYIDNSLERFDNIYAAAGHPNCVFKISFIDLQKITNGQVKNIIE
ncbi:MAG: prolyl-tRNA editing protein [Pelagibacteraceae bacterium]|nr:MAG: prolyl-tRNA editing protein [Pelagibacteraceae bacterium]